MSSLENYWRSYLRNSKVLTLVLTAMLSGIIWFSPSAGAELGDSVVTIYSQSKEYGSGQGTGFVFGEGGRIITAYHVVQDATHLEVFDKNFHPMTAVKVEHIDSERDIAILRADEAGNLPALKLTTSVPLSQEKIRIAGSPRGLPRQILYGRISSSAGFVSSFELSSFGGKRIFAEKIDVLPVDVTIYSGMSGAPVVLTSNGTVLGILSGSFDEGRGIGWVIPSKYIDQLIRKKPINKRPEEMVSWPQLSLMKPGWISLKRMYSKPFTSEHIAKLEILEGVFPKLRGEWNNDRNKMKSILYYSEASGLGRCEVKTQNEIKLHIVAVDQDKAQVIGRYISSLQAEAFFNGRPSADSQGENLAELCNERIFKDRLKSEGDETREGSFELYIERVKDFIPENPAFMTAVVITECDGSLCSHKSFGRRTAGKIEQISDTKLRWQKYILNK